MARSTAAFTRIDESFLNLRPRSRVLLQQSGITERCGVEVHVATQQRHVLRLWHLELPGAVIGAEHVHGLRATGNVDAVLLIQLDRSGEAAGLEVGKHPLDPASAATDTPS